MFPSPASKLRDPKSWIYAIPGCKDWVSRWRWNSWIVIWPNTTKVCGISLLHLETNKFDGSRRVIYLICLFLSLTVCGFLQNCWWTYALWTSPTYCWVFGRLPWGPCPSSPAADTVATNVEWLLRRLGEMKRLRPHHHCTAKRPKRHSDLTDQRPFCGGQTSHCHPNSPSAMFLPLLQMVISTIRYRVTSVHFSLWT